MWESSVRSFTSHSSVSDSAMSQSKSWLYSELCKALATWDKTSVQSLADQIAAAERPAVEEIIEVAFAHACMDLVASNAPPMQNFLAGEKAAIATVRMYLSTHANASGDCQRKSRSSRIVLIVSIPNRRWNAVVQQREHRHRGEDGVRSSREQQVRAAAAARESARHVQAGREAAALGCVQAGVSRPRPRPAHR